jgi:hypothetical protein
MDVKRGCLPQKKYVASDLESFCCGKYGEPKGEKGAG